MRGGVLLAIALVACPALAQEGPRPVEPRPRLRHAEDVLREEAAKYFAPDAVTSGAVVAEVRAALARAAGEASDVACALGGAAPRVDASSPPAPFVAARFVASVQGEAPGIARLARSLEGDRRFAIDSALLAPRAGAAWAGEVHVLALAVDPAGLAGRDAQRALDLVRGYHGARPRLADVLESVVAAEARVRGLSLSAGVVRIRLEGTSEAAGRDVAAALASEPAFGAFGEPELEARDGEVTIQFTLRRP